VAAAHGVRGALKLKTFTEAPENVGAYGPLLDETGRELFEVEVIGPVKGGIVVRAEGIADRDAAEALRGVRLFVARDRLPEPEPGAFYQEDLVGLAVKDTDGRSLGHVIGVHDFGAGEIIEYRDPTGAHSMVPFTLALVPEVDLAQGLLVIAPAASEAAR
jgi:16S rRNA processing protein RimM